MHERLPISVASRLVKMNTVTLNLSRPIGGELSQIEIRETTFREPHDMRQLFVSGSPDFDVAMNYMVAPTNQTQDQLDEISTKHKVAACTTQEGIAGSGTDRMKEVAPAVQRCSVLSVF